MMRTNLYKKVSVAVLGTVLAGVVALGVSGQTGNQTTPNRQSGQEKQMCPMMKDMKMENMDMSKMNDMKMGNMDMSKMNMPKMKENCRKNDGRNERRKPEGDGAEKIRTPAGS